MAKAKSTISAARKRPSVGMSFERLTKLRFERKQAETMLARIHLKIPEDVACPGYRFAAHESSKVAYSLKEFDSAVGAYFALVKRNVGRFPGPKLRQFFKRERRAFARVIRRAANARKRIGLDRVERRIIRLDAAIAALEARCAREWIQRAKAAGAYIEAPEDGGLYVLAGDVPSINRDGLLTDLAAHSLCPAVRQALIQPPL
jgi:hypothetical protein